MYNTKERSWLYWEAGLKKKKKGHNPEGLELLPLKYDSSQYREKHW